MVIIVIVIGLGMLWLLPRIMDFIIMADAEKRGESVAKSSDAENEIYPLEFVINESIDIANEEGIETLNDDVLKEIEENEWRRKRITIVPNN
jgi:hypothetical protein